MITIKDFMELCDFKITEGSDYTWECFGPDAYRLDSWNQDHNGHTVSIVFDTRTHEVYEASAYDYKRDRAYRLTNPDYAQAHKDEARDRGVDANQAWDDVNYVDLETDEDFLDKARCIVADEDYDTRVEVPLTLPDDSLFQLMKLAHEADLSLNQYVEKLLRRAIDNEQFVRELNTNRFDDASREVLDSQYPDGDGYWREDDGMRDQYDFAEAEQGPVEESIKKIKKRKKSK